jgi:DedD protein
MGLLSSIFKRSAAAPSAKRVSDSADAVQQLRLRARRRLIGAAVLVVLGVVGFPILFETQPRPIPVDLPIDIPRKETAAPLQIPAPQALHSVPQTPAVQAPDPVPAAAPVPEVLAPAPAVIAEASVPRAPAPESKPSPKPAASQPKATAKTSDKPAEKSKDKPSDKPAQPSQDAARALALLEGKPVPNSTDAAHGVRYIVQVGAYADVKAAHEARMKVERLGLKTYTQAVDTADGHRVRVRVGPFASREEADKAAARLRSGGLATAVLTL